MKKSRSRHHPPLDILDRGGKIDPDLDDFPTVVRERFGVALVINLPQGLVRRPVQFKFHHVDIAIRLQDQVDPAPVRVVFHLRVKPHQAKDDKQHFW